MERIAESDGDEVTQSPVFISYNHEDRDLKEQLVASLASALDARSPGRFPILDDTSIEPGAVRDLALTELRVRASVAILLLSDAYLESASVKFELGQLYARHDINDLPLIPVLLGGDKWRDHKAITRLQVLASDEPLSQAKDLERAITNLAEKIADDIVEIDTARRPAEEDPAEAEESGQKLQESELDEAALFANLSPSAREALGHAEGIRLALSSDKVHMEFLLAGLYAKPDGPARRLFNSEGIEYDQLRGLIRDTVETTLPVEGAYSVQDLESLPPHSSHVRLALQAARDIAESLSSKSVRSRHLLYGVLSVERCFVIKPLLERGVSREKIRELELGSYAASSSSPPPPPSSSSSSSAYPVAAPKPSGPTTPISVRFQSDRWAEEDLLGYRTYALAIAEFIRHPSTRATLAIGVQAPWGQGKTTLMRYVWDQFSRPHEDASAPDAAEGGPEESQDEPEEPRNGPATYRLLSQWLDKRGEPKSKFKHPTVWFNPWHFESREQVWAGLAHSIIQQLVGRLTPIEQEEFWFALQAKRLDHSAIRRDIHRAVFERFLPAAVWFATIGVLGLVALTVALVLPADEAIVTMFAGGGTTAGAALLALGRWMSDRKKTLDNPLDGKFQQYVHQPDYEGKRGFLSQTLDDVGEVIRLLVDPEFPVLIFVDDLDRCSPGKVAEVMEALNHFIGGDLRAYFIVGMDAQVVAASMEVAHEKIKAQLDKSTSRYGSLGWYYLEKFIQLPFPLPSMNDEQRKNFMASQFSLEPESTHRPTEDEVSDAKQAVEKLLAQKNLRPDEMVEKVASRLKVIRQVSPSESSPYAQQALQQAAPQFNDEEDPAIRALVDRLAPHLGASPRAIKRFNNSLRFYMFTQWGRSLEGHVGAAPSALGRWIVIMQRWPGVVRWIQWEGEEELVLHPGPADRARFFESNALDHDKFEDWAATLQQHEVPQLTGLIDRQLYDFLHATQADDAKLELAVDLGVW